MEEQPEALALKECKAETVRALKDFIVRAASDKDASLGELYALPKCAELILDHF